MTFHILNVQEGLGGHVKDGRCGQSRNEEIRRFVGDYEEKQTLVAKQAQTQAFANFKLNGQRQN